MRTVSTVLREKNLPMRKDLKEFRLDNPGGVGTETVAESMFHFIKDSEMLEVLDIPVPYFEPRWWSNILPLSIRELTLRHWTHQTAFSISFLLLDKDDYVPNLEVMSLVHYVDRSYFAEIGG